VSPSVEVGFIPAAFDTGLDAGAALQGALSVCPDWLSARRRPPLGRTPGTGRTLEDSSSLDCGLVPAALETRGGVSGVLWQGARLGVGPPAALSPSSLRVASLPFGDTCMPKRESGVFQAPQTAELLISILSQSSGFLWEV
jgi:hypothetical protein